MPALGYMGHMQKNYLPVPRVQPKKGILQGIFSIYAPSPGKRAYFPGYVGHWERIFLYMPHTAS